MPREFEQRVIALVLGASSATCETDTPTWLMRPGKTECRGAWGKVREIYNALTALELPEVMPIRERRRLDAILSFPDGSRRILEVDEAQHFNRFRAITLGLTMRDHSLGFDAEAFLANANRPRAALGAGFARPCPPLFPGDGGRHKQRAFRDALVDLVPLQHGFLPTIRVADFQARPWIDTPRAPALMKDLLAPYL